MGGEDPVRRGDEEALVDPVLAHDEATEKLAGEEGRAGQIHGNREEWEAGRTLAHGTWMANRRGRGKCGNPAGGPVPIGACPWCRQSPCGVVGVA